MEYEELAICHYLYCEEDDDLCQQTTEYKPQNHSVGLSLLHDVCMEKSEALNLEGQRFQANNSGQRLKII